MRIYMDKSSCLFFQAKKKCIDSILQHNLIATAQLCDCLQHGLVTMDHTLIF